MVRAEAPISSAGYGSNLQSQAQVWIEGVTGQAFQGEFEDCLRDGVKLCELINKIKPGTVRRVNSYKEGQKFKQVCNTIPPSTLQYMILAVRDDMYLIGTAV